MKWSNRGTSAQAVPHRKSDRFIGRGLGHEVHVCSWRCCCKESSSRKHGQTELELEDSFTHKVQSLSSKFSGKSGFSRGQNLDSVAPK